MSAIMPVVDETGESARGMDLGYMMRLITFLVGLIVVVVAIAAIVGAVIYFW
jgi:hypothetical protein